MSFKDFIKFILGPTKTVEQCMEDVEDPEYQKVLDKFNKPEYSVRADSHLKLVWDKDKRKK